MPRGRYSTHDPQDERPVGTERFHCATGPSGWRYVSQISDVAGEPVGSVDLAIDERGRPVRLETRVGRWRVRGTTLDGLAWVRGGAAGEEAVEGHARAAAFLAPSPAFWVAAARRLRLAGAASSRRLRLVEFTSPVLAPRTLDQVWTLSRSETHSTDSGPLVVDTYQVDTPDTGERVTVHLAGDVVLSAPGVELDDLDGPPSTFG